jgi:hypothetical protein
MRRRSETEENEGNEDPEFFRRDFVLFVIFCSSLFRVVVRAKVRAGETPDRPTGRMPVLRNAALEKTLSRIRALVRRTNEERNQ